MSLVDSFVGRWWVLHTRSRNEKVVATHLVRRGIQYFLPLVHHRRTYAGTIKHVSIPLFPGYVFLCGSPEDRYTALQTNRLANVLEVADQEQLKKDLRQIERVVNSDEPVDLYPRLRTGSRCRVIAGSLMGLEGVVLRRLGPGRVYIGVDFVGQSAELEIDSAMLEVLD
jgi:transcription antitermination factor NusG